MKTFTLNPKTSSARSGDITEIAVQADTEAEARELAAESAEEAGFDGNLWRNRALTACIAVSNAAQVIARTFA